MTGLFPQNMVYRIEGYIAKTESSNLTITNTSDPNLKSRRAGQAFSVMSMPTSDTHAFRLNARDCSFSISSPRRHPKLPAYKKQNDEILNLSKLRDFLKEWLPEYMMSSAFVFFTALPALDLTCGSSHESFAAPGLPAVEVVAKIRPQHSSDRAVQRPRHTAAGGYIRERS